MKKYTQEELEAVLKNAYSYENRAAHGVEHDSGTRIGTVRRGNKLFHVLLDSSGNAWYTVEFETERGIVSEFEYIFGMTERQAEYRRKARARL